MSTDARVAYALREEYDGTVEQVYETDADGEPAETVEVPRFLGGILRAGETELDVRELLDDDEHTPAGIIVVDSALEPLVAACLDEYPALKRVPVPAGATSSSPTLEDLTVPKLKERATAEGLAGASNAKRDDLVAALAYAAELRAAGQDPTGRTVEDLALGADGGDTAASPNPTPEV